MLTVFFFFKSFVLLRDMPCTRNFITRQTLQYEREKPTEKKEKKTLCAIIENCLLRRVQLKRLRQISIRRNIVY